MNDFQRNENGLQSILGEIKNTATNLPHDNLASFFKEKVNGVSDAISNDPIRAIYSLMCLGAGVSALRKEDFKHGFTFFLRQVASRVISPMLEGGSHSQSSKGDTDNGNATTH